MIWHSTPDQRDSCPSWSASASIHLHLLWKRCCRSFNLLGGVTFPSVSGFPSYHEFSLPPPPLTPALFAVLEYCAPTTITITVTTAVFFFASGGWTDFTSFFRGLSSCVFEFHITILPNFFFPVPASGPLHPTLYSSPPSLSKLYIVHRPCCPLETMS